MKNFLLRKQMSTTQSFIDKELLLDSNSKFTPAPEQSKVIVKNIPETVNYLATEIQSKSSNTLNFVVDTADFFLDTGVFLTVDELPLNMTIVKNPNATVDVTKDNFHTQLLKDYKFLTLKHLGFHNCINSFSVSIDGYTMTVNNSADIMRIMANCYDEEVLHKYFDASQPDLYCNDTVLNEDASYNYIPTLSVTNANIKVKKPASSLDTTNPYSGVVSNKFNSRTPILTLNSDGGTMTDVNVDGKSHPVTLHGTSFFLPFSIFSIAGTDISIYNSKKINITINLHNDFAKRLFNCIPNTDKSARYQFSLRTADFNNNSTTSVVLHSKLYRAPQNIESLRSESKPYVIEIPKVVLDTRTQEITFGPSENSKTINSTLFDLGAIPAKLFIAVVPKVDDAEQILTTDHYCRFNSLTIDFFGVTTILAPQKQSEVLYNLSRNNGLNMNKHTALFTKGFPVIIDCSQDLSAQTNSVIGVNTASKSGKYTVKISGDITRLHKDFDATGSVVQSAKTYELKLIASYNSYLCYGLNGASGFTVVDSLFTDSADLINNQLNSLRENIIPRMNVIGGSPWAMFAKQLKGIGNGLKNVVSAVVSNKNGIRDNLVNAYKGGANNIIGGVADNHNPLGGRVIENWGAY